MKHSSLLLAASLLAGNFAHAADNVMISTINAKTQTHAWTYMPSETATTVDGFQNNEYTLTVKPDEKYLVSEPIKVAGYESVNIDCRYYVGTKNNHPIAVDFVDMDGNTIYSEQLKGTVNQSTMTIGSSLTDIVPESPIVRIMLRLSSAYSASEYANINELQIYGRPLDWNKREVILLPHTNTGSGVTLNWVTVDDAEYYEVQYAAENSTAVETLTVNRNESVPSQSINISGLTEDLNYTYTVTAYKTGESPIKSDKATFSMTSGIPSVSAGSAHSIRVMPGQLIISSDKETVASVYSTSSVKIRETTVKAGINIISVSSGIYILDMPGCGAATVVVP